MVSSATTAVASPYPHPSQLAQLQASQGTPFILPQPPAVGATSSQLPSGSVINPGNPSFLRGGQLVFSPNPSTPEQNDSGGKVSHSIV